MKPVFFALNASIRSAEGCWTDAAFSPGGVPHTCRNASSTGLSAARAERTNDRPGMAVNAALPAAALAPRRNLRRLPALRVADAPRFATVISSGVARVRRAHAHGQRFDRRLR